jgi:glycosyltransferase involved in cell wall biosynthesis
LNILITSHRFNPDVGGIESISDILARHFCAAGHSVRLITQSTSSPIGGLSFPFTVLRRPSPPKLLDCYRWAHVLLQNNLEVRQLWPLLLYRKPIVIGLQTWIRPAGGASNPMELLKLFALDLADQLIACSEAVRRDCNPRAVVIGNPYDNELFRALPTVSRSRAIVFLGRLVRDKGADLLLRAFAALQPTDWRLSLIGDGPERADLELLTACLGIEDCVDFYGTVQGEDLVMLLNKHEIMVVPSLWREPFGVVALEGIACGCVVLASDGGGLPDAVGSAGLLFRLGDQDDLQSKLSLLINDSNLRDKLRERSEDHLVLFSSPSVSNRYLGILKDCVGFAG